MKKIIMVLLSLISMSGLTYALNESEFNPWTIEASFGMATYPNMMNHDGQTAIGRLSLGHMFLTKPYWQAGIEAGIQSGNTMRLILPKESIDALGGVPIEAKMKPLLDVMIGLKSEPLTRFPIVIWLKGGVAYRQLQLDHESVNDLNEFSPEIQVGFGCRINEQATFNLGYQTIGGKQTNLTIQPLTETGIIRYIPTQQAVLIGFSFNFL